MSANAVTSTCPNLQAPITAAFKDLQRAVTRRSGLLISDILAGQRPKVSVRIFEELGTPEELQIAQAFAEANNAFEEMSAALRMRLRSEEGVALRHLLALCGGGAELADGSISAVLFPREGEPFPVFVFAVDMVRATGQGFSLKVRAKRQPEDTRREQFDLVQEGDDLRLVLAPADDFF